MPLFLVLLVSFSCKEKEEPVEPEFVSVCNEPANPVLYGVLLDMPLRVVESVIQKEKFMLKPTTETRDGLTFSESYLVNTAINFSICKIPEAYRKHGTILSISGKGYVDSTFMYSRKMSYEEDPNMQYGTTRLVFLEDVKVSVVE